MSLDYKKLYGGLLEDSVEEYKYNSFDAKKLYTHYVQRKYFLNDTEENRKSKSVLSKEDIDTLDSITFRIARRIRRIRFPFKQQCWYVIKMFMKG